MSEKTEQPFTEGRLYRVNRNGDLGMDGEVNHLIGKTVEFVRFTKGGLAEVRYQGKLYYLPKRNLDELAANGIAAEQQPFIEGRLDGTDPLDDLFVSIGDLSTTRLDGVKVDDNQEEMVEDYIEGFNSMVLQGMPPVKALFAMAQAFGLTLGYCIRAGLHPADGRKMLGMLLQQSKDSAGEVKIVTGHTVQ